jgi:hypothetical protein
MEPRMIERNKKPGVCYALSGEGIELPVIDVTHPAFALEPSEAELVALRGRYLRQARLRARLPAFVHRGIMRFLRERSALVRAGLVRDQATAAGSTGSFMSGTATYLMKVGPDNLGAAYARPLDRKLAATLPPLGTRLRLRDMARMIAGSLGRTRWGRPRLDLVNIGGGPAMDSLNALILARKQDRALLDRPITVHVFDRDQTGPAFGERALAALKQDGPLTGLDVSLRFVRHDWADVEGLRRELAPLRETAVVASSEGALFDYGSDEAIVENLRALRELTPSDFTVVGDVVSDDEVTRTIMKETGLSLRPLGREGIATLAGRAGWRVDETTGQVFRLVKADSPA